MPIHVRDAATDRLVRRLAAKSGSGLTEAIRTAVEHGGSATRYSRAAPRARRGDLSANSAAPQAAKQTDKEFFDELSGEK